MATKNPFKNINMMTKEQYAGLPVLNRGDLYAISGSGISLPSNRYIDLTLGASDTRYTAPADGYFAIRKETNNTNQWVGFTNDSAAGMQSFSWTPNKEGGVHIFIPAKKGDSVGVGYTAGGPLQMFRFIYAEGE